MDRKYWVSTGLSERLGARSAVLSSAILPLLVSAWARCGRVALQARSIGQHRLPSARGWVDAANGDELESISPIVPSINHRPLPRPSRRSRPRRTTQHHARHAVYSLAANFHWPCVS